MLTVCFINQNLRQEICFFPGSLLHDVFALKFADGDEQEHINYL